MILLASTSDIIRIVTSAIADIEVHASWLDNNAGTITAGRTDTASITSATTTTVVGSPTGSIVRGVLSLQIGNNHASTTCTITVEHFDGTTAETLIKVDLLTNERLVLDLTGKWTHYDVNGKEYPGAPVLAVRSDMETGTDLSKAATPAIQQYHPGSIKAWGCFTVDSPAASGAPLILESYNISSMTDTGAGNVAININTDFSSANWICQLSIMRASASMTTSVDIQCAIRNATQTAGVVGIDTYSQTPAATDPEFYYMTAYGTLV